MKISNNEYYTKINFSVMNNLLKIENWKKLLFGLSVGDMCSAFQSKFLFAVSHASSNIKRNYRNKLVPQKKWISKGLLVSINRKNKL